MKMLSKSRLAMILSKLNGFPEAKVRVEQYSTDSEIAASILWNAYLLGDIAGKVIADLGCGTGILGIGALLLGASKVYFIDSDKNVLETAKNSFLSIKSEGLPKTIGFDAFDIKGKPIFVCEDIRDFNKRADAVIENPPFGVKVRHSDRVFLKKAMETAPVVYSFHKSESKLFIESFSKDNGFEITHYWNFDFPLKATMEFHRRRIYRIKVGCWRFLKS